MTDKNKIFSWLFYLSIAAVLVLFALQKVHDPDVWLHLGIGKYIVEHRALPSGDLFTYTSYGKPYPYFEWLFQTLLYLLYRYTGYHGLMAVKLGLWLLTMGFLWQWMRTEGVEPRWAAFFTLFPAFWLSGRWYERPEVAAYFLLVFYLWALSRYRQGRRYYLYCLPGLQILWVNLHPSALLGILIFLVILLGEGLDYLWDKNKGEFRVIKALAVLIPILVGVSFLNPYGYKSLITPYLYSTEKAYKLFLPEWMPLWHYREVYYFYLGCLMVTALSFLPRFFRPRQNLKLSELFLVVTVAPLPYVAARYVVLFALIALPVAAKNIYWFFAAGPKESGRLLYLAEKYHPRLPSVSGILLVMLLLVGPVLFWYAPSRSVLGWGPERLAVPQKAMEFIQNHAIPGRIFNDYEWGGYIMLAAYPRYLAFIDNRGFDVEVYREYAGIMMAGPGWERKLEQRGVNLIMVSALSMGDNGIIRPLVLKLFQDPGWSLIGSGEGTLVFLRNRPEHQPWLQPYALPKTKIFDEIILEGQYLLQRFGARGQTYHSLAWAYMSLGNFREAKTAFIEHLKLEPRDAQARQYLDFLTSQGY